MSRGRKSTRDQSRKLESAWARWLDGEGPLPLGGPLGVEVAGAGASSQTSEDTVDVDGLIADPSGLLPDPDSPLSGPMTSALVAALTARKDGASLARLAESPHRDLAKAARKAMHEFKRRGVELHTQRHTSPTTGGSAGRGETEIEANHRRASMTAPFGDGDRVVVLRFRSAGDRRLHAGVGNLSDEHGLRDLQLFLGKSSLYQQMAREMGQKVPTGEVPFEVATWRLVTAAERSRALGRLLPEHWSIFRSLAKPETETPPTHPAETLDVSTLPDPESTYALWEDPVLRAWMAPRALLEGLARRLSEIEDSHIVISDGQRTDRLAKAVDEAAEALVAGDRRSLLALRLQDAAWIASTQRREGVAGLLLALREALLGSAEPHRLPFCRQLLVRPFLARIPPALAAHLAPGVPGAVEGDLDDPETPLLWTPGSGSPSTGDQGGGGQIVPGR